MNLKCSFCFVLILFITSCNNKDKDSTNYRDRIYSLSGQGWKSKRITQFINQINYSATEVPLQYYILKDIGEDFKKVDSIYNLNRRERVIEIEFQHTEQKDLLESQFTNRSYEESVKYLAFKLENDFKVVTTSGDTLPCLGLHFERNFKVAPFKRALLYFNNINPNDNIKLIYHDNLFGNGIIKFNFSETPIKL